MFAGDTRTGEGEEGLEHRAADENDDIIGARGALSGSSLDAPAQTSDARVSRRFARRFLGAKRRRISATSGNGGIMTNMPHALSRSEIHMVWFSGLRGAIAFACAVAFPGRHQQVKI